MLKYLRIAVTAMSLTVCGLLIVLWVRNFWWSDVAWTPLPGGWQVVIASADGQVEFGFSQAQNRRDVASWGSETYTASRNSAFEVLVPTEKGHPLSRVWESEFRPGVATLAADYRGAAGRDRALDSVVAAIHHPHVAYYYGDHVSRVGAGCHSRRMISNPWRRELISHYLIDQCHRGRQLALALFSA
jgi:hypothetical protein